MKNLNIIQPIHAISNIYERRRYILEDMLSGQINCYEDFEELAICPLCMAEEYDIFLVVAKEFKYVRCKRCSFIYQKRKLKDSVRLKLYLDSEYFNLSAALQETTFESRKYKKFIPVLREIGSFYDPDSHDVKLLDLGCAQGYFLELLQEKTQWQAIGIDANKMSVKFGTQKGLNIICGDFLQCCFKNGEFDIVTCFGILGRITHPVTFLENCYRLLAKDGLLMISTPNCDGFEFSVLGPHHYYFDPIDTIGGFNKKNLIHTLKQLGFRIIAISTPGNFDLEIIKRHLNIVGHNVELTPFEKELILDDSEEMNKAREDFVTFLKHYKLSGLMQLIAQKA